MPSPRLTELAQALAALGNEPLEIGSPAWQAREAAWRRLEAQSTTEYELALARQRGFERGLREARGGGSQEEGARARAEEVKSEDLVRRSILRMAAHVGLDTGPEREAALAALDAHRLFELLEALGRTREWPPA